MRKRQHLRSGKRDSNAFNTYRDRKKTNVLGAQSIMNERDSGGGSQRGKQGTHHREAGRELAFYPGCDRRPLDGFKQRSNVTAETTEIGLKLRIKYVVITLDFMKFTLWQGKPVLKK